MSSVVLPLQQPAPASPSLARQFVLAAGIVLLFGMTAIGVWVSSRIEEAVTHNAAATTALYVDSIIAPLTQEMAQSLSLSDGAKLALNETLSQGVLSEKMFSFKIWAPDGTIVYSNEESLVGRRFAVTEGLGEAKAGRIHAEFEHLDEAENVLENASGIPLLEIYSPIREPWSGNIIAIAEFYEAAQDLRRELNLAQLQSWLVVAVVTLCMLGLLYGIVARGSRLIVSQRTALDEKVASLSRLLTQNEALHRRVEQATRRTADLNERYLRRISAELHDGPAQLLAFASLRFGSIASGEADADEARRVKVALEDAMRDIRNICRGLTLPELANLSLDAVIDRALAAHESRTHTEILLERATPMPEVSQAEKICVYRFLQEALNNATRHAGSKGQTVTATAAAQGVFITVADEGPGFDPAAVGDGLGLIGLKERIASLGGRLVIDTRPDQGTKLTMHLPGP
jgi:signal transduction histidine kinase